MLTIPTWAGEHGTSKNTMETPRCPGALSATWPHRMKWDEAMGFLPGKHHGNTMENTMENTSSLLEHLRSN